jgi:HTH-type transcriptional regulator/antitoxin HigA
MAIAGLRNIAYFEIMSVRPEDFPSPGKYIRALLEERGWNQRTLARVLGMDPVAMNRIATDRKQIDAFTALMLGEAFEVEPSSFLDVKNKYDLVIARASTTPDRSRAIRAALYGSLPIPEMIRRGWLDVGDFEEPEKVEAALARFFGVESVDKIPLLPHAAKKTEENADASPAQLAWLCRVRAVASTLQVPRYSPAAVRAAVEKLEGLLGSVEGVTSVGPILAECGIRFVIVESLSTAKIDGVCTWLNDMSPVIGMTLRHDRIDNFWFVLRHEIEHVIHGHGRRQARIDVDLDGTLGVSEEERIATDAASDFCVPRESMDTFYLKKKPFYMKQDILGFAASHRRHPGLVVGQLQHRVGRFDRFRDYLHKVRDLVIRAAAVDGWGYVYPVAESARTE